jgi:alpha-galactosidase/6-phospho-beta-glucosidase family protein
MIDASKYIPTLKESKNKDYFNFIWNSVYKKRRAEVSKRKAIYSANAIVYSELLKEWNNKNSKKDYVKQIWEKRKDKNIILEKKSDYNIYPIDDMNVILTTEEDVLNDYRSVKRKGLIKNIEDDYEIEILDKASEEYNIKLHPSLYYVMWSE